MNKLKCSVTTCRHNANDLCELRKIQVDGPRRAGKPRDLLRLLCRAHVFLRKLLRMLVFTERHS